MRLLVLGGSFDPPHRGHLQLLLSAAKRLKPDRILIVPAFQSPLKSAPKTAPEDRLEMVRRGLLEALPAALKSRASVDAAELSAGRPVFTIETLERLLAENPGAEIHCATGSDVAASFERWKEPERLRRLARWWTAARPGIGAKVPQGFRRLPGRMPDISSTELRASLSLERRSAQIVPAVASLIAERGLYREALQDEMRAALSPERFGHTVAVRRLAEALARKWNLDVSRARTAALLHDLGKSLPVSEMPAYALERRLDIPEVRSIIRHNPLLLHAFISADMARERFGIADKGVLAAVRNHTLGETNMSPLERLLYVADACSEDRSHAEAADLRALAMENLDEAYTQCLANKIRFTLSKGAWIHPLTLSAWNSLAKRSS